MRKAIAVISVIVTLLAITVGVVTLVPSSRNATALPPIQPTGRIEVTSAPSGAGFVLLGTQMYSGVTPWNEEHAPAGDYCIFWENMTDYASPLPSCQLVADNGTTQFHGKYQSTTAVGIIEVTSSPPGASFALVGPEDYSGTAPWAAEDAPVGNYCITWDNMTGYATPAPSCQDVSENETTTFSGDYQAIVTTGAIEVTSTPSATFVLTGPETYTGTTPWAVSDAPVGNYCISWSLKPGYFTPESSCQDVSDNGTTAFAADYEEAVGTGRIEVTSNPPDASFVLMGTDNYTGTTPWNEDNAPAGTYCILWGEMPGYLTPDPSCQDVTDNGTTPFHGAYEPAPMAGKIKVTSSPAGASFVLVGTENYTGTTPWKVEDAPLGDYCITWDNMTGYRAPDSSCQVVSENGTTVFHGVYEALTGTIEVTSTPAGATFTLTGAATYTGTTPWSVSDAPAGNYCITWDNMTGYVTPDPSCLDVSENETTIFNGEYTPGPWQHTFTDPQTGSTLYIDPDTGSFLFEGEDGFGSGMVEGTRLPLGEGRTVVFYRDERVAVAAFVNENTGVALAVMFNLADLQMYVLIDIPSGEESLTMNVSPDEGGPLWHTFEISADTSPICKLTF